MSLNRSTTDSPPAPPPPRRQSKGNADFWRAMRYLWPYRLTVFTSIVCALFVGVCMTGGLGTMLPIMSVLISGDSVQSWAYRRAAQARLGAQLADDPFKVQILRAQTKGGPADVMQWTGGQILELTGNDNPSANSAIGAFSGANPGKAGEEARAHATEVLRTIALAGNDPVPLEVYTAIASAPGVPASVKLNPIHEYTRWGLAVTAWLPRKPVWSIAAVFGLIALLTVVGNVVRFFQEYLSDKVAIMAVDDIRRHLYDHVLHLSLDKFGEQGTSDLTSRLVQDCNNLQDGFKTVLGQSIQEPIKAAMAFGLAMFLSWKLTVFILAFGPVMYFLIRKFGRKMRRASRKALESSSTMLGQLEATLNGIRVVKASGAERYERRRYRTIMGGLVREQLRMSRIDAYSAPTLETLTLFVAGAIVLYASYMVLVLGTLDAALLIMVMVSLASIGESLRKCSKVTNALQKSNAAAARVFQSLDMPVERPRPSGRHTAGDTGVTLPLLQREIRFTNVTFAYPGATGNALQDVNLAVARGRSIAIVGRNGSGKTTLMALLPRFYDPRGGSVSIDGVDLRAAKLSSVRRQMSLVTQDSVVFPVTIAQNIAYGNPRATQSQIESAAKRAFAHEFILEKPAGYATVLGEQGGSLSGGQRQRLCIARAILRDAPILILDEATSQVDAESEHLIQTAIQTLMHERTTFVIAHRLGTILSADEIVVMDRGRIIGQGSHEGLMGSCETYQQLYERQMVMAPG